MEEQLFGLWQMMYDVYSSLQREWTALKEQQQKLQTTNSHRGMHSVSAESVQRHACRRVELDVGGTAFVTTVSTLAAQPNNILTRVKEDHPNAFVPGNNEQLHTFIDRDPKLFEKVLAHLRDGVVDLPASPEHQRTLLREAKVYGLVDMERQLLHNLDSNQGAQLPRRVTAAPRLVGPPNQWALQLSPCNGLIKADSSDVAFCVVNHALCPGYKYEFTIQTRHTHDVALVFHSVLGNWNKRHVSLVPDDAGPHNATTLDECSASGWPHTIRVQCQPSLGLWRCWLDSYVWDPVGDTEVADMEAPFLCLIGTRKKGAAITMHCWEMAEEQRK
eukprot:TRINITY_DN16733_c0_g1_i1.p1 TRINITY_DN16733_c0_g1~~TRINITY_DN16733_c0_g1_i1.p1  ORF type:complete len:331 (-),score=42.62 TRINITY_DN16733_c0_g1_i1:36-1028(-)